MAARVRISGAGGADRPRVGGGDQRPPQRQIADPVVAVKPLSVMRRSTGMNAAERGVRPVGIGCPARVAGLRARLSAIAAHVIGKIDSDVPRRQGARIDKGEEAAAAGAATARLQAQRRAACVDRRIGAEPTRIAQRKAQFGPVEPQVGSTPKRVRSGGMAKCALPAILAS